MVGLFGRPDPGETPAPKAKPKAEPKKAAPKMVIKKKAK